MRILRHLSFSNVIATLALFLALGGAAYAGTKINGKTIVNGSIGGGKLKNETITANKIKRGTITAAQIRPGSISSSSIDLTTLGTVPSARSANNAATATKADSATAAVTATSADNARHADSATHADEADSATEADHATTAAEADTLNGETAAELTVSCPSGTEFYGGMCWDQATRPIRSWLGAIEDCGNAGGRLPTIEELIAFVLRPGEQVEGQTWSADVDKLEGSSNEAAVFTTDELGRSTETSGQLGYRCVFPRSNR